MTFPVRYSIRRDGQEGAYLWEKLRLCWNIHSLSIQAHHIGTIELIYTANIDLNTKFVAPPITLRRPA